MAKVKTVKKKKVKLPYKVEALLAYVDEFLRAGILSGIYKDIGGTGNFPPRTAEQEAKLLREHISMVRGKPKGA